MPLNNSSTVSFLFLPHKNECERFHGHLEDITSAVCVKGLDYLIPALTPDHEVSGCLVYASGVACHASVGPSI